MYPKAWGKESCKTGDLLVRILPKAQTDIISNANRQVKNANPTVQWENLARTKPTVKWAHFVQDSHMS